MAITRFVTIGEIMGRLSTPGHQRFRQAMPGSLDFNFGGAEASIAALLASLGADATYVTALPNNPIGQACVSQLRSLRVNTDHIELVDDSRMGLYFVEQAIGARPGQVIYDRADSAFAQVSASLFDWDAIFKNTDWLILTGISPAISKSAAALTLDAIGHAKAHDVKIMLDMNFRSKLWLWHESVTQTDLAAEWMRKLAGQVDLLIGGQTDFEERLQIKETKTASIAADVSSTYQNIRYVIQTRRRSIGTEQRFSATLTTDETTVESEEAIIDAVVDRIGTGDAFAAALIYAITSDDFRDHKDRLNFAVAACALAHTIPGDFSLINEEEIREAQVGKSGGRIKR
ncbi:sugar kinase [Stieleria sp. JC731]|uniref:sugar kinase n=1 Tax=Pirellulaceae TaxID=2691357 RepID=UPI001E3AFEA6|nr:sugar kinase [Stieleria sp. JC731]MCC9603551.1 sugar kinase [Stieleria sp. JC731]